MNNANGHDRSTAPGKDGGVLVNLPSTRPQRSSPRRVAARKSAQATRAGAGAPARGTRRPQRARNNPAADAPARKRPARARSTGSSAKRGVAPRQGFESDSEAMTGSIRPPGGLELATSAAELVGAFAKAGLSSGERLFKDFFSRLPRN